MQKFKLVRDVSKNLSIVEYPSDTIIYDIGEKANCLYLCLKGEVSIAMSEEQIKSNRMKEKEKLTARSNGRNSERKSIESQRKVENP